MKRTGIRREIDKLGRIVIPIEIRKSLNILEGDALEISVSDGEIVLGKMTDRCAVCQGEKDLAFVDGKYVCRSCIEKIKKLY